MAARKKNVSSKRKPVAPRVRAEALSGVSRAAIMAASPWQPPRLPAWRHVAPILGGRQ